MFLIEYFTKVWETLGPLYYLLIAFGLFYVGYGFEAWLNGGSFGRHPLLFPFQCFGEQVRQSLPGGRARWVKELVALLGDGLRPKSDTFFGRRTTWDLYSVNQKGLYAQMGRDVLPGAIPTVLWIIGPLAWPIAIPVLVVFGIGCGVWGLLEGE